MSDELTPEELEALKNLPRERMPSARLEERVVGAMRERGVLAPKRARIVRITNSRIGGLIAATIVLMVGAYSIGLHRGGENEVLRSVQEPSDEVSSMLAKDDAAPTTLSRELSSSPAQRAPESPAEVGTLSAQSEEARKPESLDWKLKTSEGRSDTAEREEKTEAQTLDEATTGFAAEGITKDSDDVRVAKRQSLQPPAASPIKKSFRLNSTESAQNAPRQRTFVLNGTAFIVDAPDSVRIDQDSDGRTLLIYTSDGVIKIRLAD